MNTTNAPGNYIEEELIKFKRNFDGTDSVSTLVFPCGSNEVLMKAIEIIAAKHDLASMYVEDGNIKSIAVFYPQSLRSDWEESDRNFNPDLFDNIQTANIDSEVQEENIECDVFEDSIGTVEESFDIKNNCHSTPIPEKSFSNSDDLDDTDSRITYENHKNVWPNEKHNIDMWSDIVCEENSGNEDQALNREFMPIPEKHFANSDSSDDTTLTYKNHKNVWPNEKHNIDMWSDIVCEENSGNEDQALNREFMPIPEKHFVNSDCSDDTTLTYKNHKNVWPNEKHNIDMWSDIVCEENPGNEDQALIDRFNNLRSEYNFTPLSMSITTKKTENDVFNRNDADYPSGFENKRGDKKKEDTSDEDDDEDVGNREENDEDDEDDEEIFDNITGASSISQSNSLSIAEIDVTENIQNISSQTTIDVDNKDGSNSELQNDEAKLSEKYTSKQYFKSKSGDEEKENSGDWDDDEKLRDREFMPIPEKRFANSDYSDFTESTLTYKKHKTVRAKPNNKEEFWADTNCEIQSNNGDQALIDRFNNLRSEYNFTPLSMSITTTKKTENDVFNRNDADYSFGFENKRGDKKKEETSDEDDDEDVGNQKENDEDGEDDEEIFDNITGASSISQSNSLSIAEIDVTENIQNISNQTTIDVDNKNASNSELQNDEAKLSEKYTSKQYFNTNRRYWNRNRPKNKKKPNKSQNALIKEETNIVKDVVKTVTPTSDRSDDDNNNVSENLVSENVDNIVAESLKQKTYQLDATPNVHIKIFVNETNSKQTNQNKGKDQIWKTAKAVQKTISEMSSCGAPDLDIIYNFVKGLQFDDSKFRRGNTSNTINDNVVEQKINESSSCASVDDQEKHNSEQVNEEKSIDHVYTEERAQENNTKSIKVNKSGKKDAPTQRKNNFKRNVRKNAKNEKNRPVVYRENTPAQKQTQNDAVRVSSKITTTLEVADDQDKIVNEVPSPIRIKLCTDVNLKGILNNLHKIRQHKDIKAMKEDEDIIKIFKQSTFEDKGVSKHSQFYDISMNAPEKTLIANDNDNKQVLENQNSNDVVNEIFPINEDTEVDSDEYLECGQLENKSIHFIDKDSDKQKIGIVQNQDMNDVLTKRVKTSDLKTSTDENNINDANKHCFQEVKKRLGNNTCVIVASEEYNRSITHIPLAIEIYNIPSNLSTENILDVYQKVSPTVDWLDSDSAILYLKSEEEVQKALNISNDTIRSRPIFAASPKAILAAVGFQTGDNAQQKDSNVRIPKEKQQRF